MLTNLEFLNVGAKWPPETELQRLLRYEANRRLFENEHADVYAESFKRIERVIGNFNQVVSYATVVNFQKKISLKTADFLWIEPPKIKAGEDESPEQLAVQAIIDRSDLYNTGYMNTLDVSRFGDGLLLVYKEGEAGRIDVTQPNIWFKVVDPLNIQRPLYHVLATASGKKGEKRTLHVQIHSRGSYEERQYPLVEGVGQGKTGEHLGQFVTKTVQTGLSDFAVIQIPNVITSDRCYGIDDYSDVDSLVSEILIRLSQISKVLDKHADPSVQGPLAALEKDPVTGQWKLKLGNYFARADKEDPPVEYVTWDGQLGSAFTQVERLINLLAVVSEMGTAVFGNAENTGVAASGTALRLRYVSLLAKIKRVSLRYTPALVKALKLCSELGGVKLTAANINVVWQDGLPNDEKERAEIADIRTGKKPTMSQKEAIMYLDGKTDAQAQASYEQILEEEAAASPAPATGSFPDNDPDLIDEPEDIPEE
jgi:hypothetical protein